MPKRFSRRENEQGVQVMTKVRIPLPRGSSTKLLNCMCAHNQPPSISQASKSSVDYPTWKSFPYPKQLFTIQLSSLASGTPSLEVTCLNEPTTNRRFYFFASSAPFHFETKVKKFPCHMAQVQRRSPLEESGCFLICWHPTYHLPFLTV